MKLFKVIALLICMSMQAKEKTVLEQAKQDFYETNQAYTRVTGLSMETFYKVFNNHTTENVIEAKKGKFICFKSNSYTLIDGIETLQIPGMIINVDKSVKQITVGDNNVRVGAVTIANLDSLLNLCKDISVENLPGGQRRYEMKLEESPYSEFTKIDVVIDIHNHRYTKVILYYGISVNLKSDFYATQEQPRLEIEYKNFRILDAEPVVFRKQNYVMEVDGKLKPAPSLTGYKLIDLRNSTRFQTKKEK